MGYKKILEIIVFKLFFVYFALFAIAFLYATVGHGGGSGYIAVLSLAGFPVEKIPVFALFLNLLVSGIGAIRFYFRGLLDILSLLRIISFSVPSAFLGASFKVKPEILSKIIGFALILSAIRLFIKVSDGKNFKNKIDWLYSVFLGIPIGFLSGMTGIGGGIFLSPVLIIFGIMEPLRTSAISSAFIFFNSIAGIIPRIGKLDTGDIKNIFVFACIVFVGGYLGNYMSLNKFSTSTIKKFLAVVLVIAATKLLIF